LLKKFHFCPRGASWDWILQVKQHQAEGKTTSAGKVTGSSELLFTGGKVISVH